MTVRAILDTKGHQIESVEPDARLSAAIKTLAERKIGAVLVMSQGRIEGILSERDIVRALSQHFDAPGHQVSHWMTQEPTTVEPKVTVQEALEIMRDPRLGAFGVAAVALALLVEAASLGALANAGDVVAGFAVAGALSRAAPVPLAAVLPYGRAAGGPGSVLSGRVSAAAARRVSRPCSRARTAGSPTWTSPSPRRTISASSP